MEGNFIHGPAKYAPILYATAIVIGMIYCQYMIWNMQQIYMPPRSVSYCYLLPTDDSPPLDQRLKMSLLADASNLRLLIDQSQELHFGRTDRT